LTTSLRVTIPLAGLNLSGGVKSLCLLANHLGTRDHRVTILAPDFAPDPPVPIDPSVRLRILGSGPSWLPDSARRVLHLARLALESTRDADICLANYFTTAWAAWLGSVIRPSRCVLAYNVRGYESQSHGTLANAGTVGRRVRAWLAERSYRLPLRKICTTEWLRQQVRDPAAIVVGHGIDLDVFVPHETRPSADVITLGTVGRDGEAKGYPDYLRALARLPADLPIRLLVAAPDAVPIPDRYPATVVRPATEPAMADFYRSCDIFVFASRGEGFGLPPLEAMACGTAVITTDCGGIHAFAEAEHNCLITSVADPSALANAIERLVANRCLRELLGTSGVRTARRFSRDEMHARFERILSRLADRN
jgi:glycosyltransferase involved in cell wall biosynthesis